jgi:hypothetical protein
MPILTRSGFGVREVVGLLHGEVLVDEHALGEAADPILAEPREDRITDREARDRLARADHDAADVAAEHERKAILHEHFHSAASDFEIDRVDARRADIDEEIGLARPRSESWIGQLAERDDIRTAVLIERERFHPRETST